MKIILSLLVVVIFSTGTMANAIHAVGRFEKFNFEFRAKNPLELSRDCITFASSQRIAHIDDIYVSFNGHKRIHLHNHDGMWHYPRHFCSELEKVANTIDLTPPAPNEFQLISALIGVKDFQFSGSHEAELFNDCIEQVESSYSRETDYLRFRLGDGNWKILRNSNGWWRGAQQICTLIDQTLFTRRAPAIVDHL